MEPIEEKLWHGILKLDVATCKTFLSKVGVPISCNKANLQLRLFYASRLGLQTIDGVKGDVDLEREKKLSFGNLKLPHPLQLANWVLPDTSTINDHDVDDYFARCNARLHIPTEGQKAKQNGKSLFLSNHVVEPEFHNINDLLDVGYLRGNVIPQTRLDAKPYFVWVLFKKETGRILEADCHCIAGLSGICKHVAAVLYSLVQDELTCTQTLQTWHHPSRKLNKEAKFMKDISTPKAGPNMKVTNKNRRDNWDPRNLCAKRKKVTDFDLMKLNTITKGNAAVLLYPSNFQKCPDSVQEETVTTSIQDPTFSNIEDAFNYLYQTFDIVKTHSFLLDVIFNKLLKLLKSDNNYNKKINQLSVNWTNIRIGRLTSSNMYKISMKVTKNTIFRKTDSIVSTVMGYYNTNIITPALKWGRDREDVARKNYFKRVQSHHSNLKVNTVGCYVYHKLPIISASPDGLVSCNCCGDGILEIKNPYTNRYLSIKQLAVIKGSGLLTINNSIVLDSNHSYYFQVQTQLLCTGLTYCDFILLTTSKTDNLFVYRVFRNDVLLHTIIENCKTFYMSVIIPELLTRKVKNKKCITNNVH